MKKFNHKKIAEKVCEEFNLTYYKQGHFTHFKNKKTEIGFIEKISSKNYLYTFLISFFDFDLMLQNDKIVNLIERLYIDQKSIIDKNIEGCNIILALRGNTINKDKLI